MMQEITMEQSTGKTIRVYVSEFYGSDTLIIFDDDTFTTLSIDNGYDGDAGYIIQGKLTLLDFGDSLLIKHGVISEVELEEKRKDRDSMYKAEQEKRQRKQYEMLKDKFS